MTNFEAQYYEAESFWANGAISDPQNSQRFEMTCSLIPQDVNSILDVGCGNGEFLRVVTKLYPHMRARGIDRSKAALKHVSAETIQGAVNAIPLEDATADCVTCLQVIEHLPCDIYPVALKELTRCSRRHVIIGVPYAEDLRTEIAQCPQCLCIFNLNLHVRSFDLPTLTQLLVPYGFELRSHVFPCPVTARWGSQSLQRMRNKFVQRSNVEFISPVCPLCGYSEGDITKISNASAAQVGGIRNRAIGLGARLYNGCMRRIWPTVKLEGYWVIALYTRRTNA